MLNAIWKVKFKPLPIFILKYNDLINQETLSFVYKYVHSHRHELVEMIEEQRKRRFILPRYKTDIGKITIQYVGYKIFNEKASLIKLNISINTFRKHIKMHMTYPGD